MKSQTILPMPQGMSRLFDAIRIFDESNGTEIDLVLKASLENTVTKWSNVCNEILKQSSTIAFAGGNNPSPSVEVEFWKARLKNLEFIYDQLRDPRIKQVAKYLEMTKSAYFYTFKNMFKDIVAGVIEARDVCLYLKPMIPHFSNFEDGELFDNEENVKPLVHCMGLVWANSKYYCANEKMVILFREIANMMIDASNRILDPSSVFQGEPDEMHEKIDKTIKILELFMDSFEHVRDNLASYFKKEDEEMPALWTFHKRTVFQRLIDFIDRLKLISAILATNLEFSKLEKVEFGGLKGRLLSQKCEQIFDEFGTAYNIFTSIQYDPCDTTDDSILKDYDEFHAKCADFDKRLAAIFSQAFDDCYNLESIFKFLAIIGNLLERTVIRNEITPKYGTILEIFNEELDTVKIIFDEGLKSGIPIDKNFPPVAGTLMWISKLKQRIEKPGEDLKLLEDDIIKTEEALHSFEKYDHMMRLLDDKSSEVFGKWCSEIPKQIEESMAKYELMRKKDNLISLNFDDELVAALREIKYMKFLEIPDIPEEALELFAKLELLFECQQRFNRIVDWYNHLKRKTLPVEYNLIEPEMIQIDELMQSVITTVTWSTHDGEILMQIYEKVNDLSERVAQCQKNLETVEATLDSWVEIPLFERREGKKENLLYLEDRSERVTKRFTQIENSYEEIKRLLELNYRLFFNIPEVVEPVEESSPEEETIEPPTPKKGKKKKKEPESPKEKEPEKKEKKEKGKKGKKGGKGKKKKAKAAEETEPVEGVQEDQNPVEKYRKENWSKYLEYVDGLVKDKLIAAVYNSVIYLLNECGDSPPILPLFELSLELHDPDIIFQPSLDIREDYNFVGEITGFTEDIFKMGEIMKRVNPESDKENYFEECKGDKTLSRMTEELLSRIMLMREDAYDYLKDFDEFTHIWTDDRHEYLRQFLLFGRLLSPEEHDRMAELKETPPSVQQFKEQIDFYDDMYKKVEAMNNEKILDGDWMRIDVRPLKQAILNTICKWGNLFKQHLYDRVINSLNELDSFIVEAIQAMQVTLAEDDYDGLLKVMGYLFKVKERQVETDNMFQPLKEIMDLLFEYGMEFPEEVHVQLQEIPDRWQQCKKVAATTKQNVAPLQALQVNAIKRRINLFEIRQAMYRDMFKKLPFYQWSCKNVYSLLDKTNNELTELETEMAKLQEQANLFELTLPEFKQMINARKEIRQIKQLWDYVNIFRSCIDEWKKTPWKKIDVEAMEMECKKFGKEVRAMDKELRGWDVYIQLEASIKNMLTSLRAVTELQNPAIRDRHWKQLMQATKVILFYYFLLTLFVLITLLHCLHKAEERLPPHYTVSTITTTKYSFIQKLNKSI